MTAARLNERVNTRGNLALHKKEGGFASDYELVKRSENIQVSQRLLAALLREHGKSPPDDAARRAVERILAQCFKPMKMREVTPDHCEELRRQETERLLAEAEAERAAEAAQRMKDNAAVRRVRLLNKAEEAYRNYKRKHTMREITEQVCRKHNLPVREVLGESRQSHVIAARHEAMARCVHETGNTTTMVSRFFRRDHTTVLAALKKFSPQSTFDAVEAAE